RARGGVEIDPDALELHRHGEERRAGEEEDVALALDDLGSEQVGEEPGAARAGELEELRLAHGTRAVVGPGRVQLLLDAEPLGEIQLAALDGLQEIADGVDREPA